LKNGLSEDEIKEIILNHMRYYFRLEESGKPNPEIEKYIGFCMVNDLNF
jgi:translation initiation factor 2 beta subunit (eIF-2beta)/eIF-5